MWGICLHEKYAQQQSSKYQNILGGKKYIYKFNISNIYKDTKNYSWKEPN